MSMIRAFPTEIRTDYGSLGGVLHYGFINPTRRSVPVALDSDAEGWGWEYN